MSKRSETVAAETCVALGATEARVTSYANREVTLGTLAVSRALPIKERIAQARADWEDRHRFGDVAAYRGPRLSAPSLVRFARPNPVS